VGPHRLNVESGGHFRRSAACWALSVVADAIAALPKFSDRCLDLCIAQVFLTLRTACAENP
jgi:hypothetical protein